MIRKVIEYIFGVCFHDYETLTKMPAMADNPGGHCQYEVTQKCKKCGKTKKFWSDVHLGMKVVENQGVPFYTNTIYEDKGL